MVTRAYPSARPSLPRRGAQLPVPVAPAAPPGKSGQRGTPDAERARAQPRRNCVPGRPAAPFLAQLSLQYDDLDAIRRKRRERIEKAARAYARGATLQRGADCGCRQSELA